MRKLLIPALLLLALTLPNCGSSSSGVKTSGIPYRAFVSNSVSGSTAAGVYIVNAETDVHPIGLAPIGAGTTPGMMVVTPNRSQTLVFSPGANPQFPENLLTIIRNSSESSVGHVSLLEPTESIIVSPDSSTAYVAIPLRQVIGQQQSQGAIELYALSGSNPGASAGEIDIPSVQYLSIDNEGDRILGFSPNGTNPNQIAVVTPANLGTNNPVVTYVGGFDYPVQAFFSSDDTTAYVVNCGPECGGNQASIQTLDMTTNPPTPGPPPPVTCISGARCLGTLPLPAGSVALVNSTTMYVAGTPYATNGQPSQPCTGQTTAAQTCGLLSVVDLPTLTQTGSAVITDGYHNRIALGANGQLFVGAQTCTEIIPPISPPAGAEVRGCLSIYNTLNAAVGTVPAFGVVIPPANGNVTGLQPISTRDVVYVVQGYPVPGGSLHIYCAIADADIDCPTADALQTAPVNQPSYAPLMVGSFYDVKTVDF